LDKEADRLRIAEILRRLDSDAAPQAWMEFLEVYSGLLLQVVQLFEADPDDVAECFVFVCEQLSRNRFHRLRKFRPGGPASFPTWMRAVTRRLCVDWYRSQSGRAQIFGSIAGLCALDRDVFRCAHQNGASLDEAFLELSARFDGLTREQVGESAERIQRSLTPRQRWLLSTRKRQFEPLEAALLDDTRASLDRLQDPAPGPEAMAVERQRLHAQRQRHDVQDGVRRPVEPGGRQVRPHPVQAEPAVRRGTPVLSASPSRCRTTGH